MSPELIHPEQFGFKKRRPTESSDCYDLGMVIYEIIGGRPPFHRHTDVAVSLEVLSGERPPRGVRFTDSLWEILVLCWAPTPSDRLSIQDVLQRLKEISDLLGPPSPEVDEVEDDSDDWDSGNSSMGSRFL